jgi:hypothetical protein
MKMLHGASYLVKNKGDKCRNLVALTYFILLFGITLLTRAYVRDKYAQLM